MEFSTLAMWWDLQELKKKKIKMGLLLLSSISIPSLALAASPIQHTQDTLWVARVYLKGKNSITVI